MCACVCVYACRWPLSCEPEGMSSLVYIKPVVCITTDDDWVTVNVCVSALLEAKRDPLLSSEILKKYTTKRLIYTGRCFKVYLDTQQR